MTQAKVGDRVRVDYTGTLDDGTQFDTSIGHMPLEFIIGAGNVIPGFENALIGMSPGETKRMRIPMEEAYGPHDDTLVGMLNRSDFPPDLELEPGLILRVEDPSGEAISIIRVVTVTDTAVLVDANHPLAGKDLTFDITLLEIL